MAETRKRADYIGYPRHIRDKIGAMVPAPKRMFDAGTVYVTRKITIGYPTDPSNSRAYGRVRKVERVFRERIEFLTWTKADQAEAVKRGYFIERSRWDNHATVIPLPHGQFTTDADVMREGKRLAIAGDAHALHLCLFVVQQDKYGWSGTWESPTIETYKPSLMWYKELTNAPRVATQRRAQLPPPTMADRTERDDLREELHRVSGGGLTLDHWLYQQPRHASFHAELAYLRTALNLPTPRPRSKGRPRGTVAEHAALRERQFSEWQALNIDEPFHIWWRRQP
jgi:hypothetical protein